MGADNPLQFMCWHLLMRARAWGHTIFFYIRLVRWGDPHGVFGAHHRVHTRPAQIAWARALGVVRVLIRASQVTRLASQV